MARKILLRSEVKLPEVGKIYLVQFDSDMNRFAKFIGNDSSGVQRWLMDKKVKHQDAKHISIEKLMLSGTDDEHIFLLSRAFSKNRIDGEFEFKLIERLMFDWEPEELELYKAKIDEIIRRKESGEEPDLSIKRKYFVIDPDGKKHSVRSKEMSTRAMMKMRSGWIFTGGASIPETLTEKDRKNWVVLPVQGEDE